MDFLIRTPCFFYPSAKTVRASLKRILKSPEAGSRLDSMRSERSATLFSAGRCSGKSTDSGNTPDQGGKRGILGNILYGKHAKISNRFTDR